MLNFFHACLFFQTYRCVLVVAFRRAALWEFSQPLCGLVGTAGMLEAVVQARGLLLHVQGHIILDKFLEVFQAFSHCVNRST
jgi:hypothetical protein